MTEKREGSAGLSHNPLGALHELRNLPRKLGGFRIGRGSFEIVSIQALQNDGVLPDRQAAIKGKVFHGPAGALGIAHGHLFAG